MSAPMLARRSAISPSPMSPAPPRMSSSVSDAAPDRSGRSRLAPAGKSTARSNIGRSCVSTNNTRAPFAVCHSWIGKVACAVHAASNHAAARPLTRHSLALVTCGSFRIWPWTRAGRQGLRIEHRDGEIVVQEVLPSDFAYLVRSDLLQLPDLQIRGVIGQTDGLQHADAHGLVINRIARINLRRRYLRFNPHQLVLTNAIVDQKPDLFAQCRLNILDRFPCRWHAIQKKQCRTSIQHVVICIGGIGNAHSAYQVAIETGSIAAIQNTAEHLKRIRFPIVLNVSQ